MLNDGSALERFAQVDTVVFDKTGTLTLPEPVLAAGTFDPGALAKAAQLALRPGTQWPRPWPQRPEPRNPFPVPRRRPGSACARRSTAWSCASARPASAGLRPWLPQGWRPTRRPRWSAAGPGTGRRSPSRCVRDCARTPPLMSARPRPTPCSWAAGWPRSCRSWPRGGAPGARCCRTSGSRPATTC